MAVVSDPAWLGTVINVLMVVVGLGMVIFVHELGHFLVAKLCGVKCEKFYLGFDFFGLKLCKFQRGETEYGIGIFPLGGYVKMLGQEDNPARLREELQRATAAQEEAEQADGAEEGSAAAEQSTEEHAAQQPPAEQIDLEAARAALYDPRSYLAQSVPKRMAIISAGVIMNVIFAFVVAVIGYALGVEQVVCGIGEVVPGKAAWQKNLRAGDVVQEIARKRSDRWRKLRTGISLGDVDDGVTLLIERPGAEKPFEVTVMPDLSGKYPTIGVGPPFSDALVEEVPAMPGTAAAAAEPKLPGGGKVVRVGDVAVNNVAEVFRQLALHPDKPLKITVRRKPKVADGETEADAEGEPAGGEGASDEGEEVTAEVAPQPMRRLGLIMEMGPVVAVQDDSPAQTAGILPGDKLQSIDGGPPGDPMTLADRLRGRAGETVKVTVLRDEKEVSFDDVRLRRADWFCSSITPDSAVSVPALGIAYRVLNTVAGVIPGSPAAAEGIAAGDQVVEAKIIPPDSETLKSQGLDDVGRLIRVKTLTVEFDKELRNWPFLLNRLEVGLPGTRVELTLKPASADEPRTVTLDPVPDRDSVDPLRGLLFQTATFTRKADSLDDAIALGYEETIDSLLLIYRTLQKLGSGQVSAKNLVGPVGIVQMASQSASQGTGELLVFLCILSANLAIINFLPIPVLDGGHMVFLAYEGIRGKPPSEGVFLALSYLGLIFILALMIWVIGLDVGRLFGA